MQVEEFNSVCVRKILIGMILDPIICAQISSQWTDEGLFDEKWANLVGSWCSDYFKKYGTSPNDKIEITFQRWASKRPSNDVTVEMLEVFLQYLSDESMRIDRDCPDHILDLAGEYFNKVRIQRAIEEAQYCLTRGKIEEAEGVLSSIRRVQLGSSATFVEPSIDLQACRDALRKERTRSLVNYPRAVGEFFDGMLTRGSLISFMGPDKTGKTTWLIDLVYRSVRCRRKTVLFDTGDGTQAETLARLMTRFAEKSRFEDVVRIPVEWVDSQEGSFRYRDERRGFLDPVDGLMAIKKVAAGANLLRMSVHPSSTIGVDGIESLLEEWDRSDRWRPDVVVIDYADILAPPKGIRDSLEQIDETWKRLRRMSQRRHCLVVTATQSSSEAYKNENQNTLLGRRHFGQRKTKLAHVNGMVGINVTESERERQMARLNWVVKRTEKNRRSRKKVVRVVGCYDIEKPVVISRW